MFDMQYWKASIIFALTPAILERYIKEKFRNLVYSLLSLNVLVGNSNTPN